MKKIFKKFGFTLAEILIVIGIIGGIAIMVLPTLKDNYEEHVFESRAKATYNNLQQAIALSKYSGDRYLGHDPEVFFNKYIKDSIKLAKVCGSSSDDECVDTFSTLDKIPINNSFFPIQYSFTLNNGASAYISTTRFYNKQLHIDSLHQENNPSILIIIFDSNGKTEPNILGLDVFITYWDGRELLPLGNHASPKEINENCTVKNNTNAINNGLFRGTFCLQYMIDNGWKIRDEIKDELL